MVVVEEAVIGHHKRVLRIRWDAGGLVKKDVYCLVRELPGESITLGGSSSGSVSVHVYRDGNGYVVFVCSRGECYATDIIGHSDKDVEELEVKVCGQDSY
ncbi:MAG: hypothetical protein F7C32_02165 [Desulfurococcales archaeon]|nr:hypothetical protein [Desulfurococcales archaeon]